jgi:hypothetical protein
LRKLKQRPDPNLTKAKSRSSSSERDFFDITHVWSSLDIK